MRQQMPAKVSQVMRFLFVLQQRDITESWVWNNYQPKAACTQLNSWLSKRGDAVHQGRNNADPKVPHLVKRDEVEKAIKFFKELVKVTDGVTL